MGFSENEKNGVVYMTAPNIGTLHAFTTRYGGVSGGIWKSLNLGENRGDDRECVRENYRRLKDALGIGGDIVFSRQVHGTNILKAGEEHRHGLFDPIDYEADGLITDVPGLPLIIFTADCIPVLLHDPVRKVIGAVHAGWRGTVSDIAGKAVRQMAETYGCDPVNIRAAIGPGIGPCCFETGPEVPEAVRGVLGGEAESYIRPGEREGKSMVDLPGVNRALLMRAGVPGENIALSGECTMCLNEKYWSHRHTKGERGSQASVIML